MQAKDSSVSIKKIGIRLKFWRFLKFEVAIVNPIKNWMIRFLGLVHEKFKIRLYLFWIIWGTKTRSFVETQLSLAFTEFLHKTHLEKNPTLEINLILDNKPPVRPKPDFQNFSVSILILFQIMKSYLPVFRFYQCSEG